MSEGLRDVPTPADDCSPACTTPLTVLADDLSGAQETFAALADLRHRPDPAAGSRGIVSVRDGAADPRSEEPLLSVNLETRSDSPRAASATVRRALENLPSHRDVFLKFDSLARGPVAAQLLAAAALRPMLFCPAVPEMGRTVQDGVIHLDGVPLAETNLWDLEPTSAPATLLELFPRGAAEVVPVPEARHGDQDLADALREVGPSGRVAVCDARTPADCRRLVRIARSIGITPAGAGGLAAAESLGRKFSAGRAPQKPGRGPVLVVVGSQSASAQDQIHTLVESREAEPVFWTPGATLELPARDAVVIVDMPADPGRVDAVDAALSAAVADAVRGDSRPRHLVLTGGQTAHSVLSVLGVHTMRPISQVHQGAVVALADDGQAVATRPGSFGDEDSLRDILRTINNLAHEGSNA